MMSIAEGINQLWRGGEEAVYSEDGSKLVDARGLGVECFEVPNGVQEICGDAFWGSSCRQIILPDSVTMIGAHAFRECHKLESIRIPEGVKELEHTFDWCTSLKEVHLPSSLRRIDEAFRECQSLERIDIPEGVEVLKGYTFLFCRALREVRLPTTLREIESAFTGCSALSNWGEGFS